MVIASHIYRWLTYYLLVNEENVFMKTNSQLPTFITVVPAESCSAHACEGVDPIQTDLVDPTAVGHAVVDVLTTQLTSVTFI